MRSSPLHVLSMVFLVPVLIGAQSYFEVISLEGTAKVQRGQKQKWDKISNGDRIYDNDMVETFFQTKLTISHGEKNMVIFGSNSKALIAITEKTGPEKKQSESSFSLFSGGMFVKITIPERFNAFTANAVGTIDSGSMAAIVDAKTGETGMLVLGGKAVVRNISQQKGKELSTGNTTIVLPGREPSPPIYITFRHVAVLKHFFGDKYIADEMQSSSITPSDDRSGSKIMLSEGAGKEVPRADALFYKRLFDINKIYGSILADREKSSTRYRAVHQPQLLSERHFSLGLRGGADITGGVASSLWMVTPEVRYPYFEAAFRFSFIQNYRAETVVDFSSSPGLADKIQRISVGLIKDSLCLTAGTMSDLTLGQGLVVNRFRNSDNNRIFNPIGIQAQANIRELVMIKAFLADVNDPSLGGVHVAFEPSIYHFGAGYYFDLDQYRATDRTSDIRYTRYQARTSGATIFPDTAAVRADVNIYELEFSTTVSENYSLSARIMCDFAQKLHQGKSDGFLLRAPGFFFAWPKLSAQGGLLFESGRILSYQFNEFYVSRRSFYHYDTQSGGSAIDTLLSLNTALWDRRFATALWGGAGINPIRGIDISANLAHNVVTRNSYVVWDDSTTDTLRNLPHDFSIDLRIGIDNTLYRYITYGGIYFRQLHGRLFPGGGTYFSSWNSEAGFSLITAPLKFDLSLECGGRFFYLDEGPYPDDVIGDSDRVYELFAGIRWDFL